MPNQKIQVDRQSCITYNKVTDVALRLFFYKEVSICHGNLCLQEKKLFPQLLS